MAADTEFLMNIVFFVGGFLLLLALAIKAQISIEEREKLSESRAGRPNSGKRLDTAARHQDKGPRENKRMGRFNLSLPGGARGWSKLHGRDSRPIHAGSEPVATSFNQFSLPFAAVRSEGAFL